MWGGERSLMAALPYVVQAGWEPLVACPRGGPLAEALHKLPLQHIDWSIRGIDGTRLPLAEIRAGLASLLGEYQPDLLHANSLSAARLSGPVAAQTVHGGGRLPSLGHLRDIVKLSRRAVQDVNSHTMLAAVSGATRQFHVSQCLDAARCVVLHNGVDLSRFAPRPRTGYLHQELRLPVEAALVATIGQLGLRKATHFVLAAARDVLATHPNLHLLIVGERSSAKAESCQFEAHLHRMAAQPPLAGHVHFLGRRHDIERLLPECQLLVHVAEQEPLGRVLLEAAACGVAVIATDVGGTREIFPAEAEAFLVPPGDSQVVAAAMNQLLCNPHERLALGRAARRRAEAAFDIRQAGPRLAALYETSVHQTE